MLSLTLAELVRGTQGALVGGRLETLITGVSKLGRVISVMPFFRTTFSTPAFSAPALRKTKEIFFPRAALVGLLLVPDTFFKAFAVSLIHASATGSTEAFSAGV